MMNLKNEFWLSNYACIFILPLITEIINKIYFTQWKGLREIQNFDTSEELQKKESQIRKLVVLISQTKIMFKKDILSYWWNSKQIYSKEDK